MRFTTLAAAGLSLASLLAVRPVLAHVPPQSTELEWHAGFMDYDSKYNIDDDLLLGFSAARNLTGGFGVEGAFQVTPGNDVKGYFAHANGVYNINVPAWDRFVPFLTAGAGVLSLAPKGGNSVTDMAINFGGGAKAFLTQRLAIRGDIRDHMVFADPSTTHNLQFSAGLTYLIRSDM